MALITCPHCGHPVSDKAARCPGCQKQLIVSQAYEEIICHECGASFSKYHTECPNCGYPVNPVVNQKNAMDKQLLSNLNPQTSKDRRVFKINILLSITLIICVLVLVSLWGGDTETDEKITSQPLLTKRNYFDESTLEFKFLDLSMFSNLWNEGIYKCGVDIDPGEYYLLSIFSSESILDVSYSPDTFPYVGNGVIYKVSVKENQYLEIPYGMVLSNANEIESITWNELGVFLVGEDLPAGEYRIETLAKEYRGKESIITNISAGYHIFDNQPGINPILGESIWDSQKYITVEDGQYLALRNAKLTLIKAAEVSTSTSSAISEKSEVPKTTAPSSKSDENTTVFCEVDDCIKTGQYTIEGFSGELEYYCYSHYNEIQDMLASLLNNTVICEKDGCGKEGIYAIEGFSGKMEYYCYTHYSDIQEMIDSLLNEPSYGDCDNCGRPAEYVWDENTVYCEACLESLLNYIYNN